MCSNMNAVNQVNAKTNNILDNFNYCKSDFKLENAAFISAATMQYFYIPIVLNGDKAKMRIWLHNKVATKMHFKKACDE